MVRKIGKVVENSPDIRIWPLVDRKRVNPQDLVMLDIKVQEWELSQVTVLRLLPHVGTLR